MKFVDYEVHPKEKVYFIIKVIAAFFGYGILYLIINKIFNSGQQGLAFVPMLFYIVLIALYLFFRMGILTGYLKGNAIKLSEKQFPEIYHVVEEQSNLLGLKYIPDVYILQSGGLLNAFAMRFLGNNYVVLYSEIVEEALIEDVNSLKFIIGHELGHIKRNHMIKRLWLLPSFIVPFLNSAYSRACEYTCDNIGHALCPQGAAPGLLILASGKKIWKQVNSNAFLEQELEHEGFWFWFAEKVSSHPRLTKRVGRVNVIKEIPLVANVEELYSPN